MHGLSVELCAPLVGEVMRVLDERLHENLRIENSILLWDHPARNGENATKDGKIKKDCPMRGYLEMDKEFRFDDSGEQEHSSKRPSDKGQEPACRVN